MRTLIFGAGGMRIGYHVGVFHSLSKRGETFDAYLGSSAGALCAAILAQYKSDELDKALIHLTSILGLHTSQVWKQWPLGIVSGAWKPSAVDSSPLRELIAKNVSKMRLRDSGKRLLIGAVDTETGVTSTFDEQHPDIIEGIIASCAVPGVFDPMTIRGRTLWDAGTRDMAPVRNAVRMGADEVTAILLTPAVRKFGDTPKNVIEAVNRAVDIQSSEILEGDLAMTNLVSRMVSAGRLPEKRSVSTRVIRPRWELQASMLDIHPGQSRRLYEIGLSDGRIADVWK